jgi:predicted TIM-barrel fold metal-dependent hydrolase
MRTITIEEHFLTEGFRKAMQRDFPNKVGRSNSTSIDVGDHAKKLVDLGSQRLQDMDAGGVDFQVISHTAFGTIPFESSAEEVRLVRDANDQLATAIATHPDRFGGFVTLPMIDPQEAITELERMIHVPGFKGIMINGLTQGRFLDHPLYFPILERAAALKVPIYIHPAEPPENIWETYYAGIDPQISFSLSTAGWGWHSEVGIHSLRLILAGIFDRLPDLQIIIGHMGEMIPFMMARINNVLTPAAKNLQMSVPAYFLRNFYITTSGFFTDPPLLLALQTFGADRILYAVDYPYSTNEMGREFLDHASISPADKEKISHLNTEQLLKLS